jgi:hypothetical protein
MSNHIRSDAKTGSESKEPVRVLFGSPLLLEGEDAAAYDELLARVCAAVKPADIIYEMLIADVISSEWDVLRWRRLKWTWLREGGLKRLESFLAEQLDYDLYSEYFTHDLAQILKANFPTYDPKELQTLLRGFAQNEPGAGDKVIALLSQTRLSVEQMLDGARARKAKELVKKYAQHEPDTVTQIHELLRAAGVSMDSLVVGALGHNLDNIERVDRLITIAEDRRNDSLREIDRRRVLLGETLRHSVQEIEGEEFKMIEATPTE